MAVKAPVASTLNPHAPLFIPAAYIDTEDFSPEWWCLVENCPAFRDYWLRERYQGMEEELSPEDLEALEMELMEEEEEMEFLAEDDSAAVYNNSENKEQDQHNTSLAKDLSALDLNSDKNDSPSLLEVP